MGKDFDYYTVLGVDRSASTGEIRKAFAELQSEFPVEARDPATNPSYQRLLNAYEVLNDSERRATYDSLVAETTNLDLDFKLIASRSRIKLTDQPQVAYLLVHIHPPRQKTKQRPLNLSLVLDRSTSMQGTRLNNMRSAVELVIEKLTPADTLSIVSFSDRANVVVPAGPVQNKVALLSQLRGLMASGGTEIYQGLNAGVRELNKVALEDHTNHLILLTDGHTYGDAENCLDLAHRAAQEGIGFSAFGIGTEWNDQFLDALVTSSGGQSGFIEEPTEIINYLQKRIKGLGAIYAQNLRLKNDFPDTVSLKHGFKLEPFAQPLQIEGEEVKLGDVEGRSQLSFLLELGIEPQSVETRINLFLSFLADIPSQQIQGHAFKKNHCFYVLADAPNEAPPEEIVEAVQALNMHRMNEKVWEEVEAGHVDVAATRMRHLTTRLQEAGETKLAQQANQELERLIQAGTMSLEGRKRLKYGTRTLINRTIHLDEHDQV